MLIHSIICTINILMRTAIGIVHSWRYLFCAEMALWKYHDFLTRVLLWVFMFCFTTRVASCCVDGFQYIFLWHLDLSWWCSHASLLSSQVLMLLTTERGRGKKHTPPKKSYPKMLKVGVWCFSNDITYWKMHEDESPHLIFSHLQPQYKYYLSILAKGCNR